MEHTRPICARRDQSMDLLVSAALPARREAVGAAAARRPAHRRPAALPARPSAPCSAADALVTDAVAADEEHLELWQPAQWRGQCSHMPKERALLPCKGVVELQALAGAQRRLR